MTQFDGIGEDGDVVELTLGGEDVIVAKSYEVSTAVLSVPASFAIDVGHAGVALELLQKYPPRTKFELRVNGNPYQSGWTDSISLRGDANGATITIKGRDQLALLCDCFVASDTSFADKTFAELLYKAIFSTGLSEEDVFVALDNVANRKAISGVQTLKVTPKDKKEPAKKTVRKTKRAQCGTAWIQFLKTEFDRAGLFVWAAGGGGLVLAQPHAEQKPIQRIVRQRGQLRNAVNVISVDFENDISRRYTRCVVHGRGGSRKTGRSRVFGEYVDDEMVALFKGNKDAKVFTIADSDVKSDAEAEFLARRRIAEANRNSWRLRYTLSGHSSPGIEGGRAVWSPDTMVEVRDDEIGVNGTFWVESVTFRRNPQTTTEIRLMRPQDLIFATESEFAETS